MVRQPFQIHLVTDSLFDVSVGNTVVMLKKLYIIVVRCVQLMLFCILTAATVFFPVYPNIKSSDVSIRISSIIVLITWRTWFLDSFSPFIMNKRHDSLQSVCFDLSKRNQRHVSTRNKCYCRTSPAAHDMINYNPMLIMRSCSNGLFTWRPITNPRGLLETWIGEQEEGTLFFWILINILCCFAPFICFPP